MKRESTCETLATLAGRTKASVPTRAGQPRRLSLRGFPSEDDRDHRRYRHAARIGGIRQRAFERDSEADIPGTLLGDFAGRIDGIFDRVDVGFELRHGGRGIFEVDSAGVQDHASQRALAFLEDAGNVG